MKEVTLRNLVVTPGQPIVFVTDPPQWTAAGTRHYAGLGTIVNKIKSTVDLMPKDVYTVYSLTRRR